ncbi:MAG TPA: hypothetical protein VH496_03235 [Mycobacterium sp.]
MTTNTTTTWIRRAAAGAVLAAAPALIAIGTATASQAQTDTSPDLRTSPSYSPRPPATQNIPWNESSWTHRHQAFMQSQY